MKDTEEKINTYFAMCEKQQVFPDEAGLILYLDISEERYEKYMRAELRRYKPYQLCLERAKLRRESILVREIFAAEKKTPSGKLFLVKQEENGGLTDKIIKDVKMDEKKKTLEVKIKGCSDYFD